jgi:hypothetical protein
MIPTLWYFGKDKTIYKNISECSGFTKRNGGMNTWNTGNRAVETIL